MSQYLYLVLLVMTSYGLSRSRERFFGNARDTYNKLMAGLASWGLLLLLTSLAQSHLINRIPVLSDEQYRYPLEAILLIAGGTFIVAALFEWLPKLIEARENLQSLQARIDFSTEMARSLKNCGGDIHQVERTVARLFKFTSTDLIIVNPPQSTLLAATEEPAIETFLAEHFEALSGGNYVFLGDGFGHHEMPVALIPINVTDNGIETLLGLWPGPESVTDTILDNLQLTADVLMTGAFSSDSETQMHDRELSSMFDSLRQMLVDADRIPDHIRLIYDQLRERIEFDLLRIAIFDQRGYNVTQYCLSHGKNLLSERDRSISTQKTQLGAIFAEPQLAFCADLSKSTLDDDRWLADCGACCALTIPLISNNTVISAITLASKTNTLSRELGERIAVDITETLLPLVKSDLMAHQLVTYNRQILDLTGALKAVVSGGDPRETISELLQMLVKKVPTTYCRLWRFNSISESLEFVADSRSREITVPNNTPTTIGLDRVYWHRQAALTGRVMVIDQRETRTQMDEDEESLALIAGTRSALIIPLLSSGKTVGLISLAELRTWERNHFSLSETLFARALANIVAQVMATMITEEETLLLRRKVSALQHKTAVGELLTELPMRLSTPLTSIMARTDQLIKSVAIKDEAASVHLLAIKRQTEKIVTEVRGIQDARRTLNPTV